MLLPLIQNLRATLNGNATGSVAPLTVVSATGSASGTALANGSVSVVNLSAVTGSASGDAVASGSVTSVTVIPATGTATTAGDAAASGSVASITVNTATGSASGSAVATGSVASITVSAATGSASATGNGLATGSVQSVSLTAVNGTANGDVVQNVAGGYGGKAKKRYVARVGGKLVEFRSQKEAISALGGFETDAKPATNKVAKQNKPLFSVSLEDVRALAAEKQALEEFNAMLKAMQHEAMLRQYEQWLRDDEDDIEALLLSL
ncbi:MAG: hypothetical protein KGL39_36655 [Patescibacteria group bacterium]|nr:hypothetical protein [Patescibacteria group bacterium]